MRTKGGRRFGDCPPAAKETYGKRRLAVVGRARIAIRAQPILQFRPQHSATPVRRAPLGIRNGTGGGILQKLFADGGYQGSVFQKASAKILPRLQIEIVKRSDQAKGFELLPRRWVVERPP